MSFGTAFLCGRRSGGRFWYAMCDQPGCSAQISGDSQAEYAAAAADGWRRHGEQVRCPTHSGAVHVQEELL